MPKPSLEGVEIKLAMARRHARAFADEATAHLAEAEYRFKANSTDGGRRHVYRCDGPPPALPKMLPGFVGDFVHNLRSALDHLAWQLVLLNNENPDGRTAFPIAMTAKRFEDMKVQYAGVSPVAFQQIEAVQPYRHMEGTSGLRWLNELDNIDKHRHLLVQAVAARGVLYQLSERPEVQFHSGPLEDGKEVVELVFVNPRGVTPIEIGSSIEVTLGEVVPHRLDRDAAPADLRDMRVTVVFDLLYADVQSTIDRFRPMFREAPLGSTTWRI